MTDVLTRKQRSYNMSMIKGKWTKQERLIHNYLKGIKIRHKMHPDLLGKPDILIQKINTVVFLDGCFWHKCPKCFKTPATRTKFWLRKINKNVENDRKINSKLKKAGYKVTRIWEHEIRADDVGSLKPFKTRIQL